MSPPSAMAEREEFRRLWPIFFGLGAVLVLAGFAALLAPNFVGEKALVIWGWFLVARGVVDAAGSFFARQQKSFLSHLLMGILAIVVGGLILTNQDKADDVLVLLIAVFFFVAGIGQIVVGLALRSEAWAYTLLSGIVGVIIGVLIWRNVPERTPLILGILIGLDLLTRGATWIGLGLAAKNAPTGSPPMAT